jgi:hypothetical protein
VCGSNFSWDIYILTEACHGFPQFLHIISSKSEMVIGRENPKILG